MNTSKASADVEVPAVIRPGEAIVSRPSGARDLSPEDRAVIARVLRDGDWLLQRLAKR
jgi:hypothetical protein